MTNLDSARPARAAAAINSVVRDDMLAIFGPGVRMTATPSPAAVRGRSSPVPVRSRGRGFAYASTMLAVVIAAGLYLGSNVVGASAPVAVSERPSPPIAIERPAQPSAPPAAVSPDPVAVVTPSVAEKAPEPIEVAATAPPMTDTAERPRAATAAVRTPRPAVVTTSPSRRLAPAPEIARPAPIRAPATEAVSTSPLIEAERGAADALRSAEQAGVRPGLLRDYRREFTLARADVFQQPDRAERVYAMISADLARLAGEAEERRNARR